MARHLALLDRELTDIETGANKRLIVQMPPRHGKSQLCSKYFPSHYLGRFPDRNVILTGATEDLACDFSSQARDILIEHGELFGVKVREDKMSMQRWQLEEGGGLRAAGVGGDIMGRGADLLIVDDYFKNVEAALSESQRKKLYQWYLSTSGTRLSPEGAIVLIATRWHKKDLIGEVLSEANITGEKWRVVSFPALGTDGAALWPEQWPAEKMEAKRSQYVASGYPWIWEALYQQNPPEVLDSEWPAHYFEDVYFDDWPDESEFVAKLVVVDPSLGRSEKSDYSAILTMCWSKGGTIYVDADLARRDVVQIVDDIADACLACRAHVAAFEENGFAALRELFHERCSHVVVDTAAVVQDRNKPRRIKLGLTPYLAQRKFRFRSHSPGVELLLEQLKGFPSLRHDDGPDALETGLRVLLSMVDGDHLPGDDPVRIST